MKVASIRLTPFSLPLTHAVHFSTGVLTAAEHLLVEVETDDGVIGVSEAIPRPMIYGETRESIQATVRHLIAPQLVGARIDALEDVGHRLKNVRGNPVAKGSVELALFDALGKSLGISCHSLLGGFTDRVAVTMILGMGSPAEVVERSREANRTYGINSFKVKVGRDVRGDIASVEALRSAFPDATICPDANHGYTAAEALAFVDGTRDCGLAWVEEPCPAEDLLGRARIGALSHTPFLGDESCINAREVATEVLDRRSSMISIKLARTGIRESIRIREFCAAVGAGVIVGSQGDSAVGTWASVAFAAASPVTAGFPAELGYFLDLEGSVCAADPEIVDGEMAVSGKPGFGFEINMAALEDAQVAA